MRLKEKNEIEERKPWPVFSWLEHQPAHHRVTGSIPVQRGRKTIYEANS